MISFRQKTRTAHNCLVMRILSITKFLIVFFALFRTLYRNAKVAAFILFLASAGECWKGEGKDKYFS